MNSHSNHTGSWVSKSIHMASTSLILASVLFVNHSFAQNNFSAQRTLNREEQANINVFKVASPSVVNISTQQTILSLIHI